MTRAMIVWLVLTVAAGTGLFVVKHEVQDLEEQLARIVDEIRRDQEAIHVLNAEWAYLTRPARLSELAARHLELKPPGPGQTATSVERLPLLHPATYANAPAATGRAGETAP
jgi:cell division protein FtsL